MTVRVSKIIKNSRLVPMHSAGIDRVWYFSSMPD